MKETIISFLFDINSTVNDIVLVISVLGSLISIVETFKAFGKKKKIVNGILGLLVCIILFFCSFAKRNLVEIPNVLGKTYQDACNILSENKLNYTLTLDNGLYVIEQNPREGVIVEKGYFVELKTAYIGANEAIIDDWEKTLNKKYGDIEIKFKDISFYIKENGKAIECFGSEIKNLNVQYAYLMEKESGIKYQNYYVEDNVLVFKEIPWGIDFELCAMLEGYEEAKTNVTISSNNTQDNILKMDLGIINSDKEIALPTTFYIADSKGIFMSGVKVWIQWVDEVWYGDYYTDENGDFQYDIWISEDQNVNVRVVNPFENGVDYECEVTLRAPRIGTFDDNDIVFLKSDGTCDVIKESIYYKY